MNTAFYVGRLSHARLTPKPHRFSYPVFMPFVDVDAVEHITETVPLWSKSGSHLRDLSEVTSSATRMFPSPRPSKPASTSPRNNHLRAKYSCWPTGDISAYRTTLSPAISASELTARNSITSSPRSLIRPGANGTVTYSLSLTTPSHSKSSFQKNFTCHPFTA